MTFGARIVSCREELGLTQKALADKMGISATRLNYWEKDKREPDVENIKLLAQILHVSTDYLLDNEFPYGQDELYINAAVGMGFKPDELELIDNYRELDNFGRKAVKAIIRNEQERCALITEKQRYISMLVYTDPAAAGIPLYAESDYERIDVPENEVPNNAEFGIRISGDSMEPSIHDGQIVWIKRSSSIADNHIGVFMLSDGTAVCKRASTALDGRIQQLLSDNSAYDPIEGDTLDGLRIVGEVLNA